MPVRHCPGSAAGWTSVRTVFGSPGDDREQGFTLCGRRWVRGPCAAPPDRDGAEARPRIDVALGHRLLTGGLGPILIEGGNPCSARTVERDTSLGCSPFSFERGTRTLVPHYRTWKRATIPRCSEGRARSASTSATAPAVSRFVGLLRVTVGAHNCGPGCGTLG